MTTPPTPQDGCRSRRKRDDLRADGSSGKSRPVWNNTVNILPYWHQKRSRWIPRGMTVLSCSFYFYFCTVRLPATALASRSHISVIAITAVRLARGSLPVVRGQRQAETTQTLAETLDLRIASALSLFERRHGQDLNESESDAAVEGEAELLEIAKVHPLYAPAQFYLGLISQTRGELEIAVAYYAATLRADPRHADATNNLASALSFLEPADRARVVTTLGLMPASSVNERQPARDGEMSERVRSDFEEAEKVVEALYWRTLDVDSSHRWGHNNLGLHFHNLGLHAEAAEIFGRAVALYPKDAELRFHFGISLQRLGKVQQAARNFMATLDSDPEHIGAALNLAALHHQYGEISDAVQHYRKALQTMDADPASSKGDGLLVILRNNLGTAFSQMGEHTLAKIEHQAVLDLLESEVAYGQTQHQGRKSSSDIYIDTLVNMHRARKASCDWRDWENLLFDLKRQVDNQLDFGQPPSLLPFDTLLLPYPVDPIWRRKIAEAHSKRYAKTPTVAPDSGPGGRADRYDVTVDELNETLKKRTEKYHGRRGTHDDRGEALAEEDAERLAARTGKIVRQGDSAREESKDIGRENLSGKERQNGLRPLHVGFVGHDFHEHPTAHMMEGIFLWQSRHTNSGNLGGLKEEVVPCQRETPPPSNVPAVGAEEREIKAMCGAEPSTVSALAGCCRYSVYSYGGGRSSDPNWEGNATAGNVTSGVRASIHRLASSFVDIYSAGHDEGAAKIRDDGVDILVDLQGHTLGGRSEIAAARPAPIQVHYLIFPGTSGAPYMDFLLADRHVTPPEHSSHYSESLVLLPRTYQANLYEDRSPYSTVAYDGCSGMIEDGEKEALRRVHGLPEDLSRAVLANFNKVDKLDPESFSLWMQILRRIPGAVLWLLDPTAVDQEREAIRNRLGDEAEGYGIDRRRIVFAARLPKWEHVPRHAAADLFVDTLIYGAHSTASDALAGGLPVLTLAGGAFASRVGVSLLRNAGPFQNLLLVTSQREYEDLAVELLTTSTGRRVLTKLRTLLHQGRPTGRKVRDGGRAGGALGRTRSENEALHAVRDGGTGDGGRASGGGVRGGSVLTVFDAAKITLDVDRAFMLMSEVRREELLEGKMGWRGKGKGEREQMGRKREERRFPHIVMTGKSGLGRHVQQV